MATKEKEIIVLFDEFGTPTFKNNNTSDYFLGVAVLYELSDEDQIFNALDRLMGLSNSTSLKNDRIENQRAVNIAKQICQHNLYITAKCIDLANNILRNNTENYTLFGNFSRRIFRGVDERKDAHFLHSQILGTCLFDVISRFLEKNTGKHRFEILIDNWNYPKTDIHIIVDYSTESLQQRLKELHDIDTKTDTQISLEPIKFLSSPNDKRKRFIDVLTSIISRSLLAQNNPKFDLQPVNELRLGLNNKFVFDHMTAELINFTHDVMYNDIQETKVKEKSKIII
ncbi:MAG: hypothetical protein AB1598_05635 [Thermodesulfobacteriota bacterium]